MPTPAPPSARLAAGRLGRQRRWCRPEHAEQHPGRSLCRSIAGRPSATTPAPVTPPRASPAQPGSPLFVQVNAAVCNNNPAQALTVPVTITSRLTGDVETFNAVETAANTGLFRIQPNVPTANAATHAVVSGDGVARGAAERRGHRDRDALRRGRCRPDHAAHRSVGRGVRQPQQPGAGRRDGVSSSTSPAPATAATPADAARVFQSDGTTPGAERPWSPPPPAAMLSRSWPRAPTGWSSRRRSVTCFPRHCLRPSSPRAACSIRKAPTAGTLSSPAHRTRRCISIVPLDPGGAAGGLLIQKTADKLSAQLGDFVDYSRAGEQQHRRGVAGSVVAMSCRRASPTCTAAPA